MSTNASRPRHHHGNLRQALVETGTRMLEQGQTFSLRSVAREVGVSQTAPYRHFQDKAHLEAAIAAEGFRALDAELQAVLRQDPEAPLVDLAVVYVRFAVAHPAQYELMFAPNLDDQDERQLVSGGIFEQLQDLVAARFPDGDAYALATAGWAMAHGLASLHRHGKLLGTTDQTLDSRVRAAFTAVLTADSGAPASSATSA